MTEHAAARIRRICAYATTAALTAAGLCLIVQCQRIYRSGEFTPELVAAYFAPIALPVWLSVILSAVGLLAELLLPVENTRLVSQRCQRWSLSRIQRRADLSAAEEPLLSQIEASRKTRRRDYLIAVTGCLIFGVLFLTYAVNPRHYHTSQINSSMLRAMTVLLPYLAAVFSLCLWAVLRENRSMDKEIGLWKQLPVLSPAPDRAVQPPRKLWSVKTAVVCCALALLLYGWFTGGTEDVLTKAVNICTECVGLG